MDFFKNIYSKIVNNGGTVTATSPATETDNNTGITFNTNNNNNVPDIIAFGNVLLDMTIQIDNCDILHKYGLKLDSQGELDSEKLNNITEEFRNKRSTYILSHPGGSALNTIRILKQLNQCNASFYGAVGEDKTAELLNDMLKENDIKFSFQIIATELTGQCLCFVYGEKCTLYANIGASKHFNINFLMESDHEFQSDKQKPQIFYIEGFFIPGRQQVCEFIVENYLKGNNKLLAINLNGSYIIEENLDTVKLLLKHSTFIFGNKTQYMTLIDEMNFKNIECLARHLFESEKRKILIVTDGNKDVELYTNYENGEIKIKMIPVAKIHQEYIIDTTGAGDSFVAGFIDSFLKNKQLDDCVQNGCNVAGKVITQIGCNLP